MNTQSLPYSGCFKADKKPGTKFIPRLTVRAVVAPTAWDDGYACFYSADYRDGVAAILARRAGKFSAP